MIQTKCHTVRDYTWAEILSGSPGLDLTLTNEELMIESVFYTAPLGLSDHVVMTFDYVYQYEPAGNTQRTYATVNYDLLRALATANRWDFLELKSAKEIWETFYSQLRIMIDLSSKVKIKSSKQRPKKHFVICGHKDLAQHA